MRDNARKTIEKLIDKELSLLDIKHWYEKDFTSDINICSAEDLVSGEFSEEDIDEAYADYVYEYRNNVAWNVLLGYILETLEIPDLPDEYKVRIGIDDIEALLGKDFVEDVTEEVRMKFWNLKPEVLTEDSEKEEKVTECEDHER